MSTDDRRRAIDRQTEMNERLLERIAATETLAGDAATCRK